MMNGPGMMGSPEIYPMMFWIPIGILVGIVLLVGVMWLVMSWLKQREVPLKPSASKSHESSQSYEQGYRSRQPFLETSQKRERRYQDPQPKQEYYQPQQELEYPLIRE